LQKKSFDRNKPPDPHPLFMVRSAGALHAMLQFSVLFIVAFITCKYISG